MHIFDSVILGIVEGVTEFLPISSTGHLILTSSLLGISQTEFQKTFEIVIQLGAILAVVVMYWRSFLDFEVLKRVVVAFVPTGIIGLTLYTYIKAYLLGSEVVVLSALFLGGIALIVFEWLYKEPKEACSDIRALSYAQAGTIGLFQTVAVIPGVSRSAATIVGGLLLGIKRETIIEFSFLLAVPTMLAASGLDLLKSSPHFTGAQALSLFVGFAVSFLVAWISIRWLLRFVRTHTFVPFGIYRVAVAALFFLIVLQ